MGTGIQCVANTDKDRTSQGTLFLEISFSCLRNVEPLRLFFFSGNSQINLCYNKALASEHVLQVFWLLCLDIQ